MIENTDNLIYNDHKFHLTVDGAKEYTGIDDLDNEWRNSLARLKQQSNLLYAFMGYGNSAEVRERFKKIDILEYLIYLDANGEREAVRKMLVEMVYWDYEYDIVALQYSGKSLAELYKMMPSTLKAIGVDSGLLYKGQIMYEVPEDEYRVNY